MKIYEITFWLCLFIVFYTYVGYGILLYLLVKIKERFIFHKPSFTIPSDALPHMTLFITAYNEESVVNEKMQNSLGLDYPVNKLHILWVTDGSNDKTNELLKLWKEAKVLYQTERLGKTAAINRGMQYVSTPIVIFTDANTNLNTEALIEIANAFTNPKVGCVAGEKRIIVKEKDNAASGGEGIYWKYESALKSLDSRLYSTVGAAGELFAIRRELFEEMNADTLLDDFTLSLRIAMRGYTIKYCAEAYAMETGSADMHEEEKRKVRIAAGGLQSMWRLRALLNPIKYKWLSFQYLSHRVLRWSITPIALFLLIPLNIILVNDNTKFPYILFLVLQAIFYIMGTCGYIISKKQITSKILFIPYYFLFMNLNVFRGGFYLLRHCNNTGTWEKAQRANR